MDRTGGEERNRIRRGTDGNERKEQEADRTLDSSEKLGWLTM